eukprot:514626_1
MATVSETIVCVILLGIIVLIIIPSFSYYLSLYYKHRSNQMIHKRHYKYIICLNLLLILSLIGDKGLYMMAIIMTDNINEAHMHILYTVSDYIYFFCGPSIIVDIAIICWMLYYDIRWTSIANPDNKWTHFIDPKYNNNHQLFANNWFIKNQSTFGNSEWDFKHIVVPTCTFIYITLFLSLFIHPSIHYYLFMSYMA